MTPDDARARFAAATVARLATADEHGVPHVVPITFALDEGRLVTAIDAKPKRSGPLRRLENIRANPRVSVLVDVYDDDWSRLWWARADGRAEIAEQGPDLARAVALLRDRYPQYRSVPIIGPAIVVTVERWSGWGTD